MAREERLDVIKEIEELLGENHKVICYVTGNRRWAGQADAIGARIADDAVRLIYDHLLEMAKELPKKTLKLDLLLVSPGGFTWVPWKLVSMIRELTAEFNTLVPYGAHSAATLICLGSDTIWMGAKGELSPIDPTVTSQYNPQDPTDPKKLIPVNVEDVTSYIDFVKEKMEITEKNHLLEALLALSKDLRPLGLGHIYRHHRYIRLVATQLLSSCNEPFDRKKIDRVISELIEVVSFHGHGISRSEAKKLGLQVKDAEEIEGLGDKMWKLYTIYENDLGFQIPIQEESFFRDDAQPQVRTGNIPLGAIESTVSTHLFNYEFSLHRERKTPGTLTLNLQLPPGFDPRQTDQRRLQAIFGALQRQIRPAIEQALASSGPIIGISRRQLKANWERVEE